MSALSSDWTAHRRQTFGDWGNVHFTAFTGGPEAGEAHLKVCAQCRKVQARWDAEEPAVEPCRSGAVPRSRLAHIRPSADQRENSALPARQQGAVRPQRLESPRGLRVPPRLRRTEPASYSANGGDR